MATVILVGHGSSRESGAGAPVHAHAATLRARGGFDAVHAAFWKEPPHVRDVLASVDDDELAVVPLFMSCGYFAGSVLPRALHLERPVTRRGRQRVHYCAPVGTHPHVPALVAQLADAAGAGPDSAVVVIGHGTEQDETSEETTWAAVWALRHKGRYGAVAGAFLDERPTIPAVLEGLEAQRLSRAVLVPLFLAEGEHTTVSIPEGVARARRRPARVTCTPPVGILPEVAELAGELAARALGRVPLAASKAAPIHAGGASWASSIS
jgi:sirohydrochlorin cobaltochelatase